MKNSFRIFSFNLVICLFAMRDLLSTFLDHIVGVMILSALLALVFSFLLDKIYKVLAFKMALGVNIILLLALVIAVNRSVRLENKHEELGWSFVEKKWIAQEDSLTCVVHFFRDNRVVFSYSKADARYVYKYFAVSNKIYFYDEGDILPFFTWDVVHVDENEFRVLEDEDLNLTFKRKR